MMVLKKWCWAFFISVLFLSAAMVKAQPPIPFRIGGSVTLEDRKLTHEEVGNDFRVVVTRLDGTAYMPAAESFKGLNASGNYLMNIPVHDSEDQPEGAIPGETALLHVYGFGKKLSVLRPAEGKFVVGNGGSTRRIDLIVER